MKDDLKEIEEKEEDTSSIKDWISIEAVIAFVIFGFLVFLIVKYRLYE